MGLTGVGCVRGVGASKGGDYTGWAKHGVTLQEDGGGQVRQVHGIRASVFDSGSGSLVSRWIPSA